ncbi:cytochrome P450 [Solihabitans fulvus]|uniref:Cytochrome P450 n=1 Tax=Solihabitans fulvus TaxID=1892852 RepID=A0A5B2WN48_9PSEU|nr:cytochrome P450 [Solihabitans fulvus]KAA2252825.1 cytochrome P450 [Solihabitans fulvus]
MTLLTREVMLDPYPAYGRLREADPVCWDDQLHGWVLTRFDDVQAALRDHETFSSRRVDALVASRGGTISPEMARFVRLSSTWMWMLDPPEHARVRGLVAEGFTPRAIRRMRPLVEKIVADLVNALADKGTFDLVADLARHVPALVVVDLFGLPCADAAMLAAWCDAIKVFLGGALDLGAAGPPAARALGEMIDYLDEAVRARVGDPRDDLISRIMAARDGEDRLSEDELRANLLLLIMAGFETSIDTIGNVLRGLLSQRAQWDLLLADPSLIPTAVDELIRHDGTIQLTHRLLTRDLEIDGVRLERGQLAFLMRGAANRDPAKFTEPDRIDVSRKETGHLGLGHGLHYCIGAGLARMEGAAVLAALTTRMPDLALLPDDPPVQRADSLQFRGLASLPATAGER